MTMRCLAISVLSLLSVALPAQIVPKLPRVQLPAREQPRPDAPTPVAPPAESAQPSVPSEGGVGIAFEQDGSGRYVVAQLAPNGPAARAKVPTGAVLRAVDQQAVAGLSFDQVRALCVGAIGTTVVLTLETDTEVLDVVLQRGPIGAANDQAPAPAGAAIGNYPAWLQPGVRVTYYTGSATLAGSAQQFVPDDNGGWSNGRGQTFSLQDVPSVGGGGFTQYDFVQVSPDCLAANSTNFTYADANLQTVQRTSSQGMIGDQNGLGELWLPRARLLAMVQQGSARRIQYPLNGQTFDAVVDDNRSGNGFIRSTYDLATGLLLVYSSATTGANVQTPAGNGSTTGAGATTITSVQLRAVRPVRAPWLGQRTAEWLRQGSQLVYGGTLSNSLGDGIVAPWRYGMQIAVTRRIGDCALVHLTTQLDYGAGAGPQTSHNDKVLGPGSTTPLYIDPERLRGMQQGQVLDQDPITRWSLTFAGSDARYAQIVEQGPLEQQSYTYDLQNGMLVATSVRTQQGPAQIRIDLQLQQGNGQGPVPGQGR